MFRGCGGRQRKDQSKMSVHCQTQDVRLTPNDTESLFTLRRGRQDFESFGRDQNVVLDPHTSNRHEAFEYIFVDVLGVNR